jgi:POT family proton-dependent oligopeptide transporter
MAFQIFYIAINVSVIVAPLISGTLGERVGWHYGFGCAGIVMVAGVLIFLAGKKHLPDDQTGDDKIDAGKTLGALALGTILSVFVIGVVFAIGLTVTLLALIPLYFYLIRGLARDEKIRVLALVLLIPMLAIALLTNQEIFNAYLVWADEHFQLTFFGTTLPTSWMITIDATLSFSMLVAAAAFYKWYGLRHREPDELGKMIIGSVFTIIGGLCLYIAALTQGGGKIGLFWPVLFHLFNSIGFAHILPSALALFSKLAPRQLNATVIGLHYLAFFAANKIVGTVGGWYSTMDTPTFWLIHVASAVVGLVAFLAFKILVSDRMAASQAATANA